jgi:hypothetical protein
VNPTLKTLLRALEPMNVTLTATPATATTDQPINRRNTPNFQ